MNGSRGRVPVRMVETSMCMIHLICGLFSTARVRPWPIIHPMWASCVEGYFMETRFPVIHPSLRHIISRAQ